MPTVNSNTGLAPAPRPLDVFAATVPCRILGTRLRGPAPAAKEPFALDEFEAQVEDRDAARHDAGICGTTLPGVQHGDRTGWLRGERELREFGLPG
jgi:hypothetical protein